MIKGPFHYNYLLACVKLICTKPLLQYIIYSTLTKDTNNLPMAETDSEFTRE